MTRSRFYALACSLLFVLAFAIGTTPVETAQAPASATGPRIARDAALAARQSKQLTATFVGADTCLACHDDKAKPLERTLHGKSSDPRTPAAAEGCETCHGPGSAHIEDPSDPSTIKRFDNTMAPRNANETCLACHTKSPVTLWHGSAHDTRNLPCETCHSVHAAVAPQHLLRTANELVLCGTCHRLQVAKVQRVSHMPLIEGKMACTSCHNPHGSTNVKQLKVGNWINESCLYCHTEKRGPFLFEHAAGRESCVSCHDPHGSNTHAMLVARPPMLCQRCHIGTRHPSTIYDNAAVQARSNRIIGRGCVNCHQNIHGSNHPSGQALVR